MTDRVTTPDGHVSTRRYDTLYTPAWVNERPPENVTKMGTVLMFVDEETSIVVTNPLVFEAWIQRQS